VTDPSAPTERQRLTVTVWLIVSMAAIGFAFDIYSILMLPLILPPAMKELLPSAAPGSPEFNQWRGMMFYIPAFAGGVFGLLGGYLTDLLGRRRVLTGSILLYAVSTFLSGYSTSLWMLLILRSATFIGVCVEFVAAVAWLAELFPSMVQREKVLGYTQAFSSFGGLMVHGVNLLIVNFATHLPALGILEAFSGVMGSVKEGNAAWRYTLMSGLIPAIPLVFIRPFLPESPAWQAKKKAGTLKRPSVLELFRPAFARTTLVTTVMFACSYGAAFGAIQQIPQIVPGLPHYKEEAKDLKPPDANKLRQEMAAEIGMVQEVGGLFGRFALALLAAVIISRRWLMRVFQWPGMLVLPLVFLLTALGDRTLFTLDLTWAGLGQVVVTQLQLGIFFGGFFTVAQFSFWGNYLPRVYPLHLRGTGESFAANIGGRMIGTSFAFVTSSIAGLTMIPGGSDPAVASQDAIRMAFSAAGVALFVYLVGSVACFFLPEPKAEAMPD
jgi:MFS family permease